MIDAGAAGVHFEDQLSSAKKCGHMGGKVLLPTRESVQKLIAARLAADVCGVPTLLVARTDSLGAKTAHERRRRPRPAVRHRQEDGGGILRSEVRDGAGGLARPRVRPLRGSDLVRDLEARSWRSARVRRGDPGAIPGQAARVQLLAVVQLEGAPRRCHRRADSRMPWRRWGTITSSSPWPVSTPSTTACSSSRAATATARWAPTSSCRRRSSRPNPLGYTAHKHQREVGAGYFDAVTEVVTGGASSIAALAGSTEEEQFEAQDRRASRRRLIGGCARAGRPTPIPSRSHRCSRTRRPTPRVSGSMTGMEATNAVRRHPGGSVRPRGRRCDDADRFAMPAKQERAHPAPPRKSMRDDMMSQTATQPGSNPFERDPDRNVANESDSPRTRGDGRIQGLDPGAGRRSRDGHRLVALQAGARRGARSDGGRGHRDRQRARQGDQEPAQDLRHPSRSHAGEECRESSRSCRSSGW